MWETRAFLLGGGGGLDASHYCVGFHERGGAFYNNDFIFHADPLRFEPTCGWIRWVRYKYCSLSYSMFDLLRYFSFFVIDIP